MDPCLEPAGLGELKKAGERVNTWIALLRAVNVGGRRIKMADLRALSAEIGLEQPETHLQSGNLVFKTEEGDREPLTARIEEAIEQRFGFHSDAILRTATEIRATLDANPFAADEAPNPSWLLVTFGKSPQDAAALERFAENYDGPEVIRLPKSPTEAFIYYAEGIGRSKLGPALAKAKVTLGGTARNIKVVRALAAMAAQ